MMDLSMLSCDGGERTTQKVCVTTITDVGIVEKKMETILGFRV